MANFFSGLAQGLNQGAYQRERDRRYALDLDERQSREAQRMVENDRADQRMAMERDQALRVNRLNDLRIDEATRNAERDKKLREGLAQVTKDAWGEREEQTPDGQTIKVVPDQNDWRNHTKYLSGVARVYGELGLLDPKTQAELYGLRKQIDQDGTGEALRRAMTGDLTGLQAIGQKMGLDPASIRIETKQDKGMPFPTTMVTGKTLKGDNYVQPLTSLQLALGLPIQDPDAQARGAAKDAANIRYYDRRGEADLIEARARQTAAATRSGGPGYDRGLEALNDNIARTKYPLPTGWSLDDKAEDGTQKTWVGRFAADLYDGNPMAAQREAERRFQMLTERSLQQFPMWVREKGQLRPATPNDKNAVSFEQLRGPDKLRARDAAIELYDRRMRQAAEPKKDEPKRQAIQR